MSKKKKSQRLPDSEKKSSERLPTIGDSTAPSAGASISPAPGPAAASPAPASPAAARPGTAEAAPSTVNNPPAAKKDPATASSMNLTAPKKDPASQSSMNLGQAKGPRLNYVDPGVERKLPQPTRISIGAGDRVRLKKTQEYGDATVNAGEEGFALNPSSQAACWCVSFFTAGGGKTRVVPEWLLEPSGPRKGGH